MRCGWVAGTGWVIASPSEMRKGSPSCLVPHPQGPMGSSTVLGVRSPGSPSGRHGLAVAYGVPGGCCHSNAGSGGLYVITTVSSI